MDATTPSERAVRLERLLLEHSYAERRSPELLAEITQLLEEARAAGALAPGATPDEVRHAIGPPSLTRGDEDEATFDWGYPRSAPPGEVGGDDWYLMLRFRRGRLESARARIWRKGR